MAEDGPRPVPGKSNLIQGQNFFEWTVVFELFQSSTNTINTNEDLVPLNSSIDRAFNFNYIRSSIIAFK